MSAWTKRSTKEMPSVPSYTPREMEVLKAAITQCGINYADVVRAAQTEGGKMAILTAANTSSLSSLVATTATSNALKRLFEKPKAIIQVSEGVGKQVLKDDKLTHQTTVVHTPHKLYKKMRAKVSKTDNEEVGPKYRSADICAVQLGVTSHLSGHTNQIAGVVLLDGNREKQEQAILGIGVLPLYEAHSHALFVPRLNIHYEDENFCDRLQLLTTFSDDVQGGGSPAMSYSTISIVRHNIADAHYLPEPLPYAKIKEKYPNGVKGLSNFQESAIEPLGVARITRNASYIPIGRGGVKTVLTFEDNMAQLREQQPIQARASFSFNNISYGQHSRAQHQFEIPKLCDLHNRTGCPCAQHTGVIESSGLTHGENLVPASSGGTEGFFFSPREVVHPKESKFVGSHPFSFPIISNVGTVVYTLPIVSASLKDTEYGRFYKGYSFMRCKPTVRLVASAPIQAKGLLWLCYDPNETLTKYPSVERALMLQGTWFMPGRHDSVTLTVDELATPAGYACMDSDHNGSFKVVIIKDITNFDVSDYGMELSLYLDVSHIGMGIINEPLAESAFLPLRQLILDEEVTTASVKGTVMVLPLNPLLPAKDGAQYYPSCSSSILENHRYWKGTLILEVIFNLPAMAGGIVELAFVNKTTPSLDGDLYRRFGSSVIDLRAHRILRARVPLNGYGGYLKGGSGALFSVDPRTDYGQSLRLAILFTSPLHISDISKKGSVLVRYLGLEDCDYIQPATSLGRLNPATTLVPSGEPVINQGTGDWCEPQILKLPLGLKQREFRLITLAKWPASGFIFFPITPSSHMPRLKGTFSGEVEQHSPLMHRSQENAQWQGKLEYYVTVRFNGSDKKNVLPTRPACCSAVVSGKIMPKPCFVERDTFTQVMPILDRTGIFDLPCVEPIASFETPPGRWVNTHFGSIERYTELTCPAWVLFQFPSNTAEELGIRDISIWVHPSISYRHAVGGFPITMPEEGRGKTEIPYSWTSTFAVG